MKAYYNKPEKSVRVVHCSEDRDGEYEIYMLVPTKIGGARRVTANRIITDDGHQFINMDAAVRHYLDKLGEKELMETVKGWAPRGSKLLKIEGTDLVAAGKWPAFAKLRKLDARSIKAMGETYELTNAESAVLGLAHDDNHAT